MSPKYVPFSDNFLNKLRYIDHVFQGEIPRKST